MIKTSLDPLNLNTSALPLLNNFLGKFGVAGARIIIVVVVLGKTVKILNEIRFLCYID